MKWQKLLEMNTLLGDLLRLTPDLHLTLYLRKISAVTAVFCMQAVTPTKAQEELSKWFNHAWDPNNQQKAPAEGTTSDAETFMDVSPSDAHLDVAHCYDHIPKQPTIIASKHLEASSWNLEACFAHACSYISSRMKVWLPEVKDYLCCAAGNLGARQACEL